MKRIDKNNYYLDLAESALERSTCLRRKWGAVIVKDDEIVSTGYNGAPRGFSDDIMPWDREGDFLTTKYAYVAHAELNASLSDDLMTEIMKLEPTDFERLVVKLLLAMGYGSGIDDAGFVTQASNDGGIDGIIKEDQLGFSSIYIQAKRWDPNVSVSRPEIQKFAGALQEQKAQKGLFISTASFSEGAKKSAEAAGIVLVDGKQLTKLMIKFNLGVSIENVYEVKRLDTDFFLEGF